MSGMRTKRLMGSLWRRSEGVALIEFALSLPLLLAFGLGGLELANLAIAHMRVSQIALMTADNASRIRVAIDEADVNELFLGADLAGGSLEFSEKGRLILSSLEPNEEGDGQWIRWQRCMGEKEHPSTYGEQGDGEDDDSLQGMGPEGRTVAAMSGTAVMFVEAAYEYQPIVPNSITGGQTITYTAAFNVRDRDNQAITNLSDAPIASC